jgi:hypothetical protein
MASFFQATNSRLAGEPSHAECGRNEGENLICGRRFLTKEEKIEWLEEYKANLEHELQGVTERIQELKK